MISKFKNILKKLKVVNYLYWKFNLIIFFFLKDKSKFDFIYKKKIWLNNNSISGFNYKQNIQYVNFLNKFIKKNEIKNIIDLGCGDYELFNNIKLDKISYLGVDVVKEIIKKNNDNYSTKKIKFIIEDIINFTTPMADLYFSRFVIQHFNNAQIIDFFKNKKRCKFFILTIINPVDYKYVNKDIKSGWWTRIDYSSYLDLSKKPFFVKNIKMIFQQKIKEVHREKEVYFETFLITN